jgi:putative ABC transport system permease protein
VRVAPGAGDLNAAIRAAARRIAPASPRPEIQSLDEVFSGEIAKPRFYFLLLGAFAAIGLALAGIGIYGVTSYAVARRSHEFGVRMALGADRADIACLVLGAAMKVVCAGAALGLAGAIAATRLLASLLYRVKPGDPVTLVCVMAVLVGVALGASLLAARRATAIDPNRALRCE